MAARWQERVAAAEREAYGRGLAGALLLLAAERRLPAGTLRTGQLAARRARQAATIVVVALIALAVAGVVAAVEVLAAVLRALA